MCSKKLRCSSHIFYDVLKQLKRLCPKMNSTIFCAKHPVRKCFVKIDPCIFLLLRSNTNVQTNFFSLSQRKRITLASLTLSITSWLLVLNVEERCRMHISQQCSVHSAATLRLSVIDHRLSFTIPLRTVKFTSCLIIALHNTWAINRL